MNWPTSYTAKVNCKSLPERDSNSHLRVTGALLNQLDYRVNWEQYSHFIQFECTKDSRDNFNARYPWGSAGFRLYFRIIFRVTWTEYFMNWPTSYTAKVNCKSLPERDSNSHLRVTGALLNQLDYRVNWEQYSHFIQFECTKDSRDNFNARYPWGSAGFRLYFRIIFRVTWTEYFMNWPKLFLHKFNMLVCTTKIGKFSSTSRLLLKLTWPAFEQGSLSRKNYQEKIVREKLSRKTWLCVRRFSVCCFVIRISLIWRKPRWGLTAVVRRSFCSRFHSKNSCVDKIETRTCAVVIVFISKTF